MRCGPVRLERLFVAVEFVEDPLQGMVLDRMYCIHEGSGLVGLNALNSLGHQPVVGLGAGLVLAREAHAQTEHRSPSSRVTPCSHSMCYASTTNVTYLLYVLGIQSTLSVVRVSDQAQRARTHAPTSIQNPRTAHQHCGLPR